MPYILNFGQLDEMITSNQQISGISPMQSLLKDANNCSSIAKEGILFDFVRRQAIAYAIL